MASVVFSTVGQALGGPLGAAVGAAVGSTVDGVMFGRRGPTGRSDLLVQRSAYGEALPRLFGRSRAAGVLIWALPMSERGGKGSGRRGTSTSIAIALSSGPIRGIGRIWADGREIRDAEGRFEVATTMRVHTGSGRQKPDPLIVAAEGAGRAPAYRGLAYVVFEDLALGAFGNRIPNLSFEVDADDGGPGAWLSTLLADAGLEAGDIVGPDAAIGYGATGNTVADDVEFLAQVAEAEISYPAGALRFEQSSRLFEIPADALGAADGSRRAEGVRSWAAGLRPGSLDIDYLDPQRDYQAGRQRVERGRTGISLVASAPLTATASQARALANRWLRNAENAVDTLELTLGWRWLMVSAGDLIAFSGRPERWRVSRRDIRGLMVHLQAHLLPDGSAAGVISDSGRALPAPVVILPPTSLTIFETPVPLRPGPAAVWIAANGDPGWRSALVSRLDAGAEALIGEAAGTTASGHLEAPLGPGVDSQWDEVNALDVSVLPGSIPFESRSGDLVLNGANLVRVGSELLQFRDARPISEGLVRLSGLLRGRFGTGFAGMRHAVGARVEHILIDRLLASPMKLDSIGSWQVFLAEGRGDPPGGTEFRTVIEGAGFSPMAPCHLLAERRADGSVHTSWVPRGSNAFDWGSAEPAQTSFRWRFVAAGGLVIERETFGLQFDLSVAEQVAACGTTLPAGAVTIEARGDGPHSLRVTAPFWI